LAVVGDDAAVGALAEVGDEAAALPPLFPPLPAPSLPVPGELPDPPPHAAINNAIAAAAATLKPQRKPVCALTVFISAP
jgi:hypothetical protein